MINNFEISKYEIFNMMKRFNCNGNELFKPHPSTTMHNTIGRGIYTEDVIKKDIYIYSFTLDVFIRIENQELKEKIKSFIYDFKNAEELDYNPFNYELSRRPLKKLFKNYNSNLKEFYLKDEIINEYKDFLKENIPEWYNKILLEIIL